MSDLYDRDIGKIEPALEKLIAKHGIDAVRAALVPLIGQFKWETWQRVSNLAKRLDQRKRPKLRKTDALK